MSAIATRDSSGSIDFLGLPHCDTQAVDDTGVPIWVFARQRTPAAPKCPDCGLPAASHGSCIQNYVDRPLRGKPVVIRLETKRARCKNPDCETKTFQLHHDDEFRGTLTKRCRKYIEDNCFSKTFASLAGETGIPEATVRRIADEVLAHISEGFRIDTPTVLAIDDLHLPSGKDVGLDPDRRGAFPDLRNIAARTVISDAETSQVVDLLSDTSLATVSRFLINLQGGRRVRFVTMDMSETYRDAVWLALGDQVTIIADRWHVVDRVNAIVDKARSKLVGADKALAKGLRRALLARGPELEARNPHRYEELLDFLNNVPTLRCVYEAKERLLNIYTARSRLSAERQYEAWQSDLDEATAACYSTIIKMVENWRTEVFAYWNRGYSEYRYDDEKHDALIANLDPGSPLAPLVRRLSKVLQWKGPNNGPAEARNQIIRLVNRVGRSYSFRFIRARAIFSTYDVAANFGICVECRLPFKRDRRSRRHSGERRSHELLRGRRIQDGAAIAPTCRDCDPRSTGGTRPGAKPVDPSVTHCGLRDIWTAPETRIADDPQALLEVESRYRILKRRYRKRLMKGDFVGVDRMIGDLFGKEVDE